MYANVFAEFSSHAKRYLGISQWYIVSFRLFLLWKIWTFWDQGYVFQQKNSPKISSCVSRNILSSNSCVVDYSISLIFSSNCLESIMIGYSYESSKMQFARTRSSLWNKFEFVAKTAEWNDRAVCGESTSWIRINWSCAIMFFRGELALPF